MRLLLFDIDGTLLDSGGAGLRALWLGLVDAFGLDAEASEQPVLDLAGATDHGVAGELFARFGIVDSEAHRERFFTAYLRRLEAELQASPAFRVMPGCAALLDRLHGDPGAHLALLTGNTRDGAYCKLRRAGFDRYFAFGAFGTDRPHRDELGPVALDRARQHLRIEFASTQVIVIGDTPRDVRCAHAFGAACLGVATGSFDRLQLEAAGADAVLDHLDDLERFEEALERLAPLAPPAAAP